MKIKFRILLLLFMFILASCSGNDDNESAICIPTSMSMIINGESVEYNVSGTGIDWDWSRQKHILDQSFYYSSSSLGESTISYSVPHKLKGKNVFETFVFRTYLNGSYIEINLLNEDFESEVITNSNTCLYAVFSGKFTLNNQEIIITEGKASFIFENPIQISF